ncbi:MAG: hypothetical protein RSD36_17470 [Terrisporobacter sp.]
MKLLVNGYTVTEHLQLKRNNEFVNYIDEAIGHIKSNKKKYIVLVLLIALTVDFSTINAFAVDTSTIDKAGNEILDLMRKVGYWVTLILCSKDVIKHSMRGHLDSIGTVITLHGIAFGTLYFLPWLFDLIKGLF